MVSSIIFSILTFLIMVALLITVHEFGHFIVARRFGVKILRFSIGFGKPLFNWRDQHGTEYSIARYPLGGYVKMLDEPFIDGETVDKASLLSSQSLLRRILIATAGPAANLIFSVLVFWIIYMVGISTLAPVVGEVASGSIAENAGFEQGDEIIAVNHKPTLSWQDVQIALLPYQGDAQALTIKLKNLQSQQESNTTLNLAQWDIKEGANDFFTSLGIQPYMPVPPVIGSVLPDSIGFVAGFQEGDKILRVDDQEIDDWRTFANIIQLNPDKTLSIEVLRGASFITLTAKPESKYQEEDNSLYGYLGLLPQNAPLLSSELRRTRQYNPLQSFGHAVLETFTVTKMTFSVIARIIKGKLSLGTISGPIGIAYGAGQSASLGIVYFLSFLAFVSISLAVLNILPIPMLDGGHILYYIIEALRGKPLSANFREFGVKIGFSILILVMGVAFYNDLGKLFN